MEDYEPKVIPHKEFREIAVDFADPLDAVREAISNSLDAQAQNILILATSEEIDYQKKLALTFKDDGIGMTMDRMHAFFDLGNSKWDQGTAIIGRKGHGTKIFYRSERVEIQTVNVNHEKISAVVDKPWIQMQKKQVPRARIDGPFPSGEEDKQGTTIRVIGFFDNKASFFEHDKMKDYIRWFSAWGSVKPMFSPEDTTKCLELQGVDRNEPESIEHGHPFPTEDYDTDKIRNKINSQGLKCNITDLFCKVWLAPNQKITKNATVVNADIIFAVEGGKLRALPKNVTATDRYGLWLARDYILVEQKNEWLFEKAIWTQFHIVVNCQHFELTANRGSVGNSSSDVLDGVKEIVVNFYNDLRKNDSVFKRWEDLKDKEEMEAKKQREYANLRKRLNKADNRDFIDEIKKLKMFKPHNEAETLHLLSYLVLQKVKDIDFEILDIESKTGIDLIASWHDPATQSQTLKVIEVEHRLQNFTKHQHFFRQVHAIVCWDKGQISPGTRITDLEGQRYELKKSNDRLFFQNEQDGTDVKRVYLLSEIVKKL